MEPLAFFEEHRPSKDNNQKNMMSKFIAIWYQFLI